jgi:hypothetical protein
VSFVDLVPDPGEELGDSKPNRGRHNRTTR